MALLGVESRGLDEADTDGDASLVLLSESPVSPACLANFLKAAAKLDDALVAFSAAVCPALPAAAPALVLTVPPPAGAEITLLGDC